MMKKRLLFLGIFALMICLLLSACAGNKENEPEPNSEEPIAEHTHVWDSGVVTKEATTETAGERKFTCTVCGTTKTEMIPPVGHNYAATVTDPTCTADGYTTYTCTDCGSSYVDSIVPALGHTWDDGIVTTAPTCIVKGVKTYTCIRCPETYTEDVATIDHTPVTDPAVAATCTNPGLTAGSHCSVCGTILTAQTATPSLGHDFGSGNACKRCGKATSQGLKFTSNGDGTCYLSGIGTCTDTEIVIPPVSPDGDRVIMIGHSMFYGASTSTSVVIPEGVTSIGEKAFTTVSLTSVTIPSSMQSIDSTAFHGYHGDLFYEGTLSDWLKNGLSCRGACYNLYIQGNLLTDLVIPEGIYQIGWDAFAHSTLTSVELSSTVTHIESDAFDGCSSLESISVAAENPIYHSAGNCIIETATGALTLGCKNSIIPSDGSVTRIGYEAFSGCTSLTSIEIPDSVTNIGYNAFKGCSSLASVTFGENGKFEAIDTQFSECSALTSITIPNGVKSIASNAFSNCKALQYNTYDNAKYLGNASNPYLALIKAVDTTISSCTIHPGTKLIVGYAFASCTALTSIEIPDSVTSIGPRALENCPALQYHTYDNARYLGNANNPYHALIKAVDTTISSCTIHPDTKLIAGGAFYSCGSLSGITFPDSLTSIGECAFYDCPSLTSLEIPDSVTSIGECAFYDCPSLTSIEIPDSVTYIGYEAFYKCSNLKSVYITDLAKWCEIFSNSLYDDTKSNPLLNGADLYLNGELVTELIVSDMASIGIGAFYGCTSLTSVKILDGVTSIGMGAFWGCRALTNVEIPDSVTYIGMGAFYECTALTNIEIPDSVTYIGIGAFCECTALTGIEIPDSVTSIGESAFFHCTALTNIKIPDGITSIIVTFYDCTALMSIEIPDSVACIAHAFWGCRSLTSITYQGTKEQWNAISKSYYWNYDTGSYVIHCTDGDISKQ